MKNIKTNYKIVDNFCDKESVLIFFSSHNLYYPNADGIFAASLIDFSARMGENVRIAYQENLFRMMYNAYGFIGLLAGVPVFAVIGYKIWMKGKFTVRQDVLIWMLSVLILLECLFTSVRAITFPLYGFILFKTLHGVVKREKTETETAEHKDTVEVGELVEPEATVEEKEPIEPQSIVEVEETAETENKVEEEEKVDNIKFGKRRKNKKDIN